MTYMMTMNSISAVETGVVVPDTISDRRAGAKGNTVVTIVRNVPDGVTAQQISRMTDLASTAGIHKDGQRYVFDYAELPLDDGLRFPG